MQKQQTKFELPLSLNNKLFNQAGGFGKKSIYVVELLKIAVKNKAIVKKAQKSTKKVIIQKKKGGRRR